MNILSIQYYLEKLGLSEIESKLYLGLLESGNTTVLELARKVKIKRATVHFNIESLIQKGLVTQSKYGARRQIVAEPPEILLSILDDKISDIGKLEGYLPNIIKMIYKSVPDYEKNSADQVQVKYFEGMRAMVAVYEEIFEDKELHIYTHINKLSDIFPEYRKTLKKILAKPGHTIKEIVQSTTKLANHTEAFGNIDYVYKELSVEYPMNDFYQCIIGSNKVVLIGVKPNSSSPSAIIVNNTQIYGYSQFLFSIVWGSILK